MDSNFWSNLFRLLFNWKRVDKFKELMFCDKKRMPLRSLNVAIIVYYEYHVWYNWKQKEKALKGFGVFKDDKVYKIKVIFISFLEVDNEDV